MAPLKTLAIALGVTAAITLGTIEALLRGRLEGVSLWSLRRSMDRSLRLRREHEEIARSILDNQRKILALTKPDERLLKAITDAVSGGIGGDIGRGLG